MFSILLYFTEIPVSNHVDPDQIPSFAASELG